MHLRLNEQKYLEALISSSIYLQLQEQENDVISLI